MNPVQCQFVPSINFEEQTRTPCLAEADPQPRLIAIVIGANTLYFEVKLCPFHTAKLTFDSAMAPVSP